MRRPSSQLIVAVMLAGVLWAVAAAPPTAAALTLSPGSLPWMYTGAGSGSLGTWTTAIRSTSTDAEFALARSGVWVYGDSITRADYGHLAAGLSARGLPSAVDAQGSLPSVPAVERLAARVARQGPPRVLVMATGSNDIYRPTFIAGATRTVRAVVGPTTRVVWVNVFVRRASVGATMQAADLVNTKAVNAATALAPADAVVDWYGYLTKDPARLTTHLRDGVHTTAVGQAARNGLILAAVQG